MPANARNEMTANERTKFPYLVVVSSDSVFVFHKNLHSEPLFRFVRIRLAMFLLESLPFFLDDILERNEIGSSDAEKETQNDDERLHAEERAFLQLSLKSQDALL